MIALFWICLCLGACDYAVLLVLVLAIVFFYVLVPAPSGILVVVVLVLIALLVRVLVCFVCCLGGLRIVCRCGQSQLAAAALHALDGVPVHSLALHSLHGDPSRTAEAALVRLRRCYEMQMQMWMWM